MSLDPVLAGSATYDFSNDPSASGLFVNGTLGSEPWRSSGGNPGGYLSLTEAVNDHNNSVTFPDLDRGAFVKAFRVSADVRIGNPQGNGGLAGDGFSLSFARAGDPVLAAGNGSGFVYGLQEMGTTSGLAVLFDAWQGNLLPDGRDIQGLIVRLDNRTLLRRSLPVRNGSCVDTNSIQTGAWDGATAPDGGIGDPSGLCWAKLEVELNEQAQLTVKYKGALLVDRLATGYLPHAGQFVLAGRCGGGNQNQNFDNLQITTEPAQTACVTALKPDPAGCFVDLTDQGSSVLDSASVRLAFDGAEVAAARLSLTKQGATTHIQYHAESLLLAGSTHAVQIDYRDTNGVAGTAAGSILIGPYVGLPPTVAVQSSSVDRSRPGFLIRPYQTEAESPTSLQWIEEQLAAKHGTNLANLEGADAQGFFMDSEVVNFSVEAPNEAGNFNASSGYPDRPFPGLPGIRGGTKNTSMEILAFVEFPAAGTYEMGVNSDDGFRVSTALNVQDTLGLVCGQFDGGRGSADTIFSVVVQEPGIYPLRLVWMNSSLNPPDNKANLEWFTVVDRRKILINDRTNPGALRAYQASTAAPAARVVSANPGPYAQQVPPDASVAVEIADGASPVDAGSVVLKIDDVAVPAAVVKSGGTTTVAYAPGVLASASVHRLVLSFQDTASPPAPQAHAWQFTVLKYPVLPTALASPLGSEGLTQPGFNVRTWQLAARGNTMPNNIEWGEGVLAGLVGEPAGNSTGFLNGIFAETGTINYAAQSGQASGNFQPDRLHPGIEDTNNYVSEFVTYIPFAAPGFHTMGVNCDNNFRVTVAERVGRQYLRILSPASLASDMAAVATAAGMNVAPGFGGPLPVDPLEADAVVLGTSCLADPELPDLTGKIAVIPRGACPFIQKCLNAQSKGALAVVIANSEANEGNFPIIMGGDEYLVTIPVMMVDYDDGQKLVNNPGGLRLSIGRDNAFQLAEYNADVVNPADLTFSFYVPQAGVYPFRCFYLQSDGSGSVEWFTVAADGTRRLLNDTTPGALLTYRTRGAIPVTKPTISVTRTVASVSITYTGVLEAADEVAAPWVPVPGASSPYTVPADSGHRFYRTAQ